MLSITIITKNEESNLRRLLPVLAAYRSRPNSHLSEIVILDSGSQDASREIALRHGCLWHEEPFRGYGPQKRRVSALAKESWILNLDADEVPTDEFWHGLDAFFLKRRDGEWGATLTRDFVFLGRELRFGGAGRQRKLRLFHKEHLDWNDALLHEDVMPLSMTQKPRIGHVAGLVHHYSWPSVSHWLRITAQRTEVYATERGAKAYSPLHLRANIVLRFFLEFVRGYILRLGILDGVAGFTFCLFMSFSQTLKYVRIYERQISLASSRQGHFSSGPSSG